MNHSPKLSIIVPSYNQGKYLEETLLSIINQDCAFIELIIIDGGSKDNSVEIIKKYEPYITYWVSEKDSGQSHAINKGIQKASGEWVAWMNSDDCYLEGAFNYIFNELDYDKYDFMYGNCFIGESLNSAKEYRYPSSSRQKLKDIVKFFYNHAHIIPSQSVFVRKSILDEVGTLDESLHYCMDLEWYCRIFLATDKRFFYDKSICFFRINEQTKTGSSYQKMQSEAIAVLYKYLTRLPAINKRSLLKLLFLHRALKKAWKKEIKQNLFFFIRVLMKAPRESLSDKRFLGLMKNRLLSFR